MYHLLITGLLILMSSIVCAATNGEIISHKNFGANPGNLNMSYLSDEKSNNLVVVLHGCTQQASRYADGSGWTTLAKQHNFDLLLPSQKSENNAKTCFNWYQQQDITRNQGELKSIIEMIGRLESGKSYQHIYVTGVSAGAAMAMALVANYPEQFAGAGLVAGISYQCGIGLFPALQCMKSGSGASSEQLRERLSSELDVATLPKLSLWHGADDSVVNPQNSSDIAKQWLSLFEQDSINKKQIDKSQQWQQTRYQINGKTIVEHNIINQLGHSQSVDHDDINADDYLTNNGISTAYYLAKFFELIKT